jgi:hypothetical protein
MVRRVAVRERDVRDDGNDRGRRLGGGGGRGAGGRGACDGRRGSFSATYCRDGAQG